MKLKEFDQSTVCSECGGPAFSDLVLAEKKDACYSKVRSRYKVWPSAYASGALVQCRKKGAANWGNKSKNESLTEFAPGAGDDDDYDSEDVLFRLAQMWYTAADEATEQRAEQTLAKMGWEIGGLESEEGGAFVMEIGDDEGHSYIAWSAEDLEQGLAEMDKSQPSHGRDGKISHSTYGSRDRGGSTGPERTAKATTADKMMKHAHDVMMKSMSDADKVKKGWRNPNIKEQGVAEGLNEFAPAGSGGGNIPRGPKTPKRGPWDDDGEDPYQLRHYNRSVDFFDQFDSDGVDKQNFDKATGEYEGYYFDRDAASGITQIAYFKFDDPTKIGDNDPGVGWYYEPVDEGVAEGNVVSLDRHRPTEMSAEFVNWLRTNHPQLTMRDLKNPEIRNRLYREFRQLLAEKCWDTHRQAGMKKKGNRMVPNCVPKESVKEGKMDLNKLRDQAKNKGEIDLNKLKDWQKTDQSASKPDKDKKSQQKKGGLDLATLRAGVKNAKLASELGEDFDPEYDDEAGMADNNLQTLERAVQGIDDLIDSGDNLPEWCQEKIANAKSMLVAVWDYMRSEEDREEDPEDVAMYEAIDTMARALAKKYNVSLDEAWESFEALPDHVLYETAQFRLQVLNEDWQKVNKQDRTDGMSRRAVKAYRRENPGSKLKTAVTTKPSKLKKGGKAAKRRKSFCARMRGMKKSRASAKTKRNPNSPINKALRRWNC